LAAGRLYLLPCLLGDEASIDTLSQWEISLISDLKVFLTENERSCRRFMRKAGFAGDFDTIELIRLDKDTSLQEIESILKKISFDLDAGILSEAGAPAIADPGAPLIRMAFNKGIQVIPVPGPSAIMLAISSSGLNGQQFSFHGYLPVDSASRIRKLRELQDDSKRTGYAHFFIETPYRNNAFLKDCLSSLHPSTLISIASNLTLANAFVNTETVDQWKKDVPELHKIPAVFGILAQ
jgi:16S rRNA (cytidine1402-2'-O)-methyltransferase